MCNKCISLTALVAALSVGDTCANEAFVNSRRVVLSYRPADSTPVDEVSLWVSTDRGASWEAAPFERDAVAALRYDAARDGRFDFYLVLRNAAGASADPPTRGSRPHVSVIVDTAPPLLQVHAHTLTAAAAPQLSARVSLIEENLAEGAVRVFYRTSVDKPWIDGGEAIIHESELTWTVPAGAAGRIEMRITVTDRAGNVTIAEIPGVVITRVAGATVSAAAATQPAGPVEDSAPALTVEPVAPVPDSTSPPAARAGVTSPASPQTPYRNADALRRLALEYMKQGRYELAAARIADALAAAPDDVELLVMQGSAEYRAGRYSTAETAFAKARRIQAGHTPAIEGLALVAATQKRYADARGYLRDVLRFAPNDAKAWLRLGDMEHRLGALSEARHAWLQAAELTGADDGTRAAARRRLNYFRASDQPDADLSNGEGGRKDPGNGPAGGRNLRR